MMKKYAVGLYMLSIAQHCGTIESFTSLEIADDSPRL